NNVAPPTKRKFLKERAGAPPAPCYSTDTKRRIALPAGHLPSGRRGSLTARVCAGDSHLDLLRLGFLALGNAQRQHAIFIVSFDGIGIHGVGKSEAASERTIGAFHAQIILLVDFFLELAFTANRQNVVLHADVQLLRAD